MLKVDYLENVINHFEDSGMWFFMRLKSGNAFNINPKDLLTLPPDYLRKMREFVSSFTLTELEDMDAVEFIQESTGEEYSKIEKLINVAKKKQSIEQDFV